MAGLMAAGLLVTALAVPMTSGLAAAPAEAAEGSDASTAPASGETVSAPADGIDIPLSAPVAEESPENGTAVPISEESTAVPISEEGTAVPISDEPDGAGSAPADGIDPDAPTGVESSTAPDGATASATADPSAAPALTQVTLADLTKVAEYLAGKAELTPEEVTEYDLNGTGTVTLTDLTQLAAIYASELNDPAGQLPEPNPEYATSKLRGAVTSIDTDDNIVYIKETSPDAVDDVGAVISDETIIIDCQSGAKQTVADLKDGDVVVAYLSMAMMPSLPPKAACYALITNLPEELGMADYVCVSDMNTLDDGGVVVLNQNADLWITIPSTLEIGVFGEDKTASTADIEVGTRLIVWYDLVMESYPAQTTALRCMIVPVTDEPVETIPQPDESAQPEQSVQPDQSAQPEQSAQPDESAQPEQSAQPDASPTPAE